MKTFLDDAGRIELPDFVQEQLGVRPGDELALEEQNGRWYIQSARAPAEQPPPEQRQPVLRPADTGEEDYGWEELDYDPIPLRHAGSVAVRIERRGRMEPMVHDLDFE
jgi:bifunctional DNA-binding transcriptional regulator/antitoxin component of YhaV-PrlF toxin-antitoxin module